jgi:hypothetical protein
MSRLIPRTMIVLFALMTAATFGGPLAIALVLQGGRHSGWPPDRAVEWLTLAGTSVLVVALMIVTIGTSIAMQRKERRAKLMRDSGDPRRPPREAESER